MYLGVLYWESNKIEEGDVEMNLLMLGNDTKEGIEKRLQIVASAGYLL